MKKVISKMKFLLSIIIIVIFTVATSLLVTQFASASIATNEYSISSDSGIINNNVTLPAQKDSYIISSSPNINQGASEVLKVQQLRQMRTILSFDLSPYENVHVSNAELRIFAQLNGINWGKGESMEIHKLTTTWTEGNGVNAYTGTGLGVTWICATDSNITNTISDCNLQWNGGSFVPNPTDVKQVSNKTTGVWLEFNVTSDVNSFLDGNTANNFGWMIKKTNEQTSGSISFASRESSSNQPQLVLSLSSPNGLKAIPVTQTTFTANWQPVTGATAYDVTIIQLSNQSNIMTQKDITSTSTVIQGLTSGTQYSWSVIAKNSLFNSAPSVAKTWTISAPPTGITVQPTSLTTANVSWNASQGASYYHIILTPAGKSPSIIFVPATSYSLANLTSNTNYTLTLSSGNPSGYSVQSAPVKFTTLLPPNGLKAIPVTQTTFTANWQPVTGATAYDVTIIQLSNQSNIMTQKDITSTSTVIQGLTSGTQYSWSVIAKNALVISPTSSIINTWTISAPPTGITIQQPTSLTTANVSWNASQGASYYHITLTPAGKSPSIIFVPATSYSLANLTSNTNYTLTLSSGNPSGYSVQSAPVKFYTFLLPPNGLEAIPIAQTTFTANWQPVTGATAYKITAVPLSNQSKIITQKNIPSTSTVIQGLTSGTQYSWSVIAKNSLFNSAPSVAKTWTISAPPTGITVQPTSLTTANVSWNASQGASYYHITLTPAGKSPSIIFVPATSYSLANLTSNTNYTLTLSSGNPSGYSVQSAPVKFTTSILPYDGSIGMITFAFGHAFDSESLGIDNMTKYNFVGNISPVESKIDVLGWMTKSQLLAYKKDGWEILAHSITHPKINNTTPKSLLQFEIVQSKQNLTKMGFCVTGYESPFDIITNNSSIYIKNNYKYAVIDPNHQNTVYSITHDGAKWNFPIAIHYTGVGKGIGTHNFAGAKALIDYAIVNHTYLILNFHQIDSGANPYYTDPSLFWQILQYVKQKSDAGQIKVENSAQALGIQCP